MKNTLIAIVTVGLLSAGSAFAASWTPAGKTASAETMMPAPAGTGSYDQVDRYNP